MSSPAMILVLISVVSYLQSIDGVFIKEPDVTALLDFKKTIKNDPYGLVSSWSRKNPCSGWTVGCDDNGRVISIDMSSYELTGKLPSSFGKLSKLQYLNLGSNRFSGPLPSTISGLTSLEYLYLSSNKFEGSIPSTIGSLRNLKEINLSSNRFSGPVPSSLGKISSLTSLILANNRFYGPLPSTIGSLSNLAHLVLTNNQLSGSIPSSLSKLTGLSEVSLANNYFTGKISPQLANFCSNYIIPSTRNNCLTVDAYAFACSAISQRSTSACKAFCNAFQSGGPCGGQGVCSVSGKKATCSCKRGYATSSKKPLTCSKV